MTIHLNLPPAMEEAARRQAMLLGEDVETFLLRQLEITLQREKQEDTRPSVASPESIAGFKERLTKWIRLHPQVPNLDVSRESIYAGRGE